MDVSESRSSDEITELLQSYASVTQEEAIELGKYMAHAKLIIPDKIGEFGDSFSTFRIAYDRDSVPSADVDSQKESLAELTEAFGRSDFDPRSYAEEFFQTYEYRDVRRHCADLEHRQVRDFRSMTDQERSSRRRICSVV